MEAQVMLLNVFLVAKHQIIWQIFNRKVIYWKDIGWLIGMREKLEKKAWKKVGVEVDLGVPVAETSQLSLAGPHCWNEWDSNIIFSIY